MRACWSGFQAVELPHLSTAQPRRSETAERQGEKQAAEVSFGINKEYRHD